MRGALEAQEAHDDLLPLRRQALLIRRDPAVEGGERHGPVPSYWGRGQHTVEVYLRVDRDAGEEK
jgi:hypothetical protein